MEQSFLIQRLEKPFKNQTTDDPFAFGGGLVNGGISKEGMNLLRDIFRFDYMGAAEFEFGAVPKALQTIAKNAEQYITTEVEVTTTRKPWKFVKGKQLPPITNTAKVYIICNKDWADEVKKRITKWAKEESPRDTLERICLIEAVCPVEKWDQEKVGWLELDNGYFFFTDKEMFEKTAKLFGIE